MPLVPLIGVLALLPTLLLAALAGVLLLLAGLVFVLVALLLVALAWLLILLAGLLVWILILSHEELLSSHPNKKAPDGCIIVGRYQPSYQLPLCCW